MTKLIKEGRIEEKALKVKQIIKVKGKFDHNFKSKELNLAE